MSSENSANSRADVTIRIAEDADMPALVEFRLAMFRDMGWEDERRLEELAPLYEAYVREHAGSDEFVAWIAEHDGVAVASVALLWERVPPTVRNMSGRQAYIMSMYVVPQMRRQGIASRLVGAAVEFARSNGADVVRLHHSPAGKELYEGLGFALSPEMRLFTDPLSAAWSPESPGHVPADEAD